MQLIPLLTFTHKIILKYTFKKAIFNAYILPHLDYCCTIWGYSTNESLNQIFKFQKRAARIILDQPYDAPSAALFKQLKWMTIFERIEYKTQITTYTALNNGPEYMSSKFHFTEYSDRQLRSCSNKHLQVPKPNLEIYRKSISYSGANLWNTLPLDIRTAPTLHKFKSLYLKYKFPGWENSK